MMRFVKSMAIGFALLAGMLAFFAVWVVLLEITDGWIFALFLCWLAYYWGSLYLHFRGEK